MEPDKKGRLPLWHVRRNQAYYFVLLLFIFSIFYNYFVVPPAPLKTNKSIQGKSFFIEKPDLTEKNREKAYAHVLQSVPGDVFRLGVLIRSKNKESLEILAESPFNEHLKIGEWELEPSDNSLYREIIFPSPGRYENIVFQLKEGTRAANTASMEWADSEVFIQSFFVTRLEMAGEAEIKNLKPTLFGVSTIKKELLTSASDNRSAADNLEWVFQADGDYLEAIEFSGDIVGSGRHEYTFEFARFSQEKKEKTRVIKKIPFILDALDDYRLVSGNYKLPLFSPLEQGRWYSISFSRNTAKDYDNLFKINVLKSNEGSGSSEKSDLALHIGVRSRQQNGTSFPDGAKLEDLGRNLFYSFSLQEKPVDYTNVFDMSEGVTFDGKKRLVSGRKKNGEFFTYKFDTLYPFRNLTIEARQEGSVPNEIKLEYSFDNSFWKEIPSTQEKSQSPTFFLMLSNPNNGHVVYVRASFQGEEKKTGLFALDKLSVKASVGYVP